MKQAGYGCTSFNSVASATHFACVIHDTHHPVGSGLYDQRLEPEAKRYTGNFLHERSPKYLG